jgi:PAS domain S-box-containing protein
VSVVPDPRHPGSPAVRVADQRARLQEVAAALAQTVDPRAIAALIVDAACDGLETHQGWVTVVTLDGHQAEVLLATGYAPAELGTWGRVPLSADLPMTAAIRTGQPIYRASAAARNRTHPVVAERGGPAAGTEASAEVPISIEGRVIGALGVSFGMARELDADERWFLGALASQVAHALERARLFAALREQDERLRFALEASGTGTWEWNIPEDRLTWSSEVSDLYARPPDEVPAGLSEYLQQIHPDDRDRVTDAIRASVEGGAPYDIEFRILRADGALQWNHGVGKVFLDPEGRPQRMLGTTRDVTDRKLAEAERDRYLEAERETARLRDAFIGVVSHELRTPITTIYGGTRVLARRWRDLEPDALDQILTDVVEEADRLYRLAEDLLVLTRVERGTLDVGDEPVHLGRLIERVVTSERGRWPEVRFDVRVPSDLPSLQGEDTYVEQVLRNLLGNAAKYGDSGSTVTIEASATPADVELRVSDEGPGIEEGEAELLFDLFYRSPTVAATHAGGGIGLFVCRQLVRAMGGRIRAERRSDGGARFIVALPRYADDDIS